MSDQNQRMQDKQGALIALALVKYMASRREFTLNPSEDGPSQTDRLAKKIGVGRDVLQQYIFQIVLPVALNKHFGDDKIQIVGVPITLKQEDIESISIKMIREESLDISPKTFNDRLERMSRETHVSKEELRNFYLQFILPHMICKISGWSECQIIAKS